MNNDIERQDAVRDDWIDRFFGGLKKGNLKQIAIFVTALTTLLLLFTGFWMIFRGSDSKVTPPSSQNALTTPTPASNPPKPTPPPKPADVPDADFPEYLKLLSLLRATPLDAQAIETELRTKTPLVKPLLRECSQANIPENSNVTGAAIGLLVSQLPPNPAAPAQDSELVTMLVTPPASSTPSKQVQEFWIMPSSSVQLANLETYLKSNGQLDLTAFSTLLSSLNQQISAISNSTDMSSLCFFSLVNAYVLSTADEAGVLKYLVNFDTLVPETKKNLFPKNLLNKVKIDSFCAQTGDISLRLMGDYAASLGKPAKNDKIKLIDFIFKANVDTFLKCKRYAVFYSTCSDRITKEQKKEAWKWSTSKPEVAALFSKYGCTFEDVTKNDPSTHQAILDQCKTPEGFMKALQLHYNDAVLFLKIMTSIPAGLTIPDIVIKLDDSASCLSKLDSYLTTKYNATDFPLDLADASIAKILSKAESKMPQLQKYVVACLKPLTLDDKTNSSVIEFILARNDILTGPVSADTLKQILRVPDAFKKCSKESLNFLLQPFLEENKAQDIQSTLSILLTLTLGKQYDYSEFIQKTSKLENITCLFSDAAKFSSAQQASMTKALVENPLTKNATKADLIVGKWDSIAEKFPIPQDLIEFAFMWDSGTILKHYVIQKLNAGESLLSLIDFFGKTVGKLPDLNDPLMKEKTALYYKEVQKAILAIEMAKRTSVLLELTQNPAEFFKVIKDAKILESLQIDSLSKLIIGSAALHSGKQPVELKDFYMQCLNVYADHPNDYTKFLDECRKKNPVACITILTLKSLEEIEFSSVLSEILKLLSELQQRNPSYQTIVDVFYSYFESNNLKIDQYFLLMNGLIEIHHVFDGTRPINNLKSIFEDPKFVDWFRTLRKKYSSNRTVRPKLDKYFVEAGKTVTSEDARLQFLDVAAYLELNLEPLIPTAGDVLYKNDKFFDCIKKQLSKSHLNKKFKKVYEQCGELFMQKDPAKVDDLVREFFIITVKSNIAAFHMLFPKKIPDCLINDAEFQKELKPLIPSKQQNEFEFKKETISPELEPLIENLIEGLNAFLDAKHAAASATTAGAAVTPVSATVITDNTVSAYVNVFCGTIYEGKLNETPSESILTKAKKIFGGLFSP